MIKFKVGDKVRCVDSNKSCITAGRIYEIVDFSAPWYRVITDHGGVDGYLEHVFELVEPNPVLTPEEVFEHLRKGTKLEVFGRHNTRAGCYEKWLAAPSVKSITYNNIVTYKWRIKPEPEVIELNGKKYREIVE